ncbi:MAG: hypothetical protein N2385_08990, partial [Chloroflexus sp.]|nr:hypothetical protein [Chloroflexus sp.]
MQHEQTKRPHERSSVSIRDADFCFLQQVTARAVQSNSPLFQSAMRIFVFCNQRHAQESQGVRTFQSAMRIFVFCNQRHAQGSQGVRTFQSAMRIFVFCN